MENDCDEGFELMLQGNGSVCVTKECGTFSRAWFIGAAEDVVQGCGCGDLSSWIHSWREVRRGRRFLFLWGLFQRVHHEGCGVPVCLHAGAPWSLNTSPQLTLDFAQKDLEYKTNEVSEKVHCPRPR